MRVGAERAVGRHVDEAADTGTMCGVEHVARAVVVHGVEVGERGRVDDSRRVHDVGDAVGGVEQGRQRLRVADVADHRTDPLVEGLESCRLVGVGDEADDRSGAFVEQGVDERGAEPTAGAGHDGRVGRRSHGASIGHRSTSSTKRRAFRSATAITEACGFTPGASGSNDASLT